MKYLIILAVTLGNVFAGQDLAPLRKGDDASRIIEVLGPANGSVQTAQSGILFYDRGEVHTRHGKVSHIYLISEEELAEQNEEEMIERAKLKIEGEARLAELKEQGGFNNLSGRDQVNFWKSFSMRYPDVDIQFMLQEALAQARIEEDKAKEEQRIARLEERVLEAELRAAQAEKNAAEARVRAAFQEPRVRVASPYVVIPNTAWSTSGWY